ncbi:receptor-like protein 35 [Quercus suber]|uniref:Receptor-like protein 35 n=1 Tax=Quercus suber TaxID=58331 RepID=A0AAW0MB49_QUESU
MKIPFFSWLYLITICSLFANFGIFVVSDQCLHDQRDLLIGMKNSLKFNSTSSTKLVHWNSGMRVKIAVCGKVEKGRVIGLNLFNESISGSLHNSSLFSLQYLENLNLACNKLSASLIPSQFGNLTNLIYLNLSNAGFEGQIPIEISNLSRLVTLDLSINIFLSDSMLKIEKPYLATLVQNFGKLEELYLDAVNISAPGNEWCQALSSSAPNLRVLSMEHFQKVSSKFLHCRRFTYQMTNYFKGHCQMQLRVNPKLYGKSCSAGLFGHVSFNSFTGLIPSFSMAKNLTQIYLSHNKLTGQITSTHWNDLPNLVNLHLSSNSLGGSIPVSLFSLPLLQTLGQYQCLSLDFEVLRFSHFLQTTYSGSLQLNKIQQLRNLSNLDLSHNSFSIEYNETTSSLSSFTQIATLRLASRNLPTFPDFLRNQSKLVTLDLSINQIPGEIPNWIWNLTNLLYLNLSIELGFIFGFGIVIWPLMFCKRWSRWYFKHVDNILIRIFPQLNLGIKYRQRRAHINQGRRH